MTISKCRTCKYLHINGGDHPCSTCDNYANFSSEGIHVAPVNSILETEISETERVIARIEADREFSLNRLQKKYAKLTKLKAQRKS